MTKANLAVGMFAVLLVAVGVLIGMELRGNEAHAAEGRFLVDAIAPTDGGNMQWVVLDTATGATSYHSLGGMLGHAQQFKRDE